MVDCLRCGQCCCVPTGDGDRVVPCEFLVNLGAGKGTSCKIYDVRLGKDIGFGMKCGMRENTGFDFEGCPYNSGKPLRKIIRKQ